MSAAKATPFDRMLLAGMALQGLAAAGDGRAIAAQARMSVERADALLTALAETPPPACVDVTALSLPDQLGQTLDFWLSNFRHVLTAGQL